MSTWINYHHLLYFKMIAEESSVSKAAEKLRLGQPTLSAQLKQFEDNLGVQLFERQHKKLILTEQGKVALDYAKTIFKLGNEMYEVLHDKLVMTRTHLQIGALDNIAKQITLQLAKAAYQVGNCQVSIIEGKSDEIIRELMAHKIDIVVSDFVPTGTEAKGLIHRKVIKKQVAVFGAQKFKSLRKNFPQSLKKQPFIMPTYDSRLRYNLDHWAKVNEIDFDIIAETQDISLKKLMAIEGLGLMPAAKHTVTRQVLKSELIEIGELKGIEEELFLISAERKIVNPIASQLMKTFSL